MCEICGFEVVSKLSKAIDISVAILQSETILRLIYKKKILVV